MNAGSFLTVLRKLKLSIKNLLNNLWFGFRNTGILSEEMVHDMEFKVMECVIRQWDTVKIIRWKPFNKDWMVKGDCGWTIFAG